MDKMFWESVEQANERLSGTYIMYGDKPYYVEGTSTREAGPSARLSDLETGKTTWKVLTDEAFHNFHRLPPLGFVNIVSRGAPVAVYMARIPERSRAHGLKDNRVAVHELGPNGMARGTGMFFSRVAQDKGYTWRVANIYPTAQEIMDKLPENCSTAFSPQYAILKDSSGLFRLFRKTELIGLITDRGLRLSPKTVCYREELEETEAFNIPATEVV